MDIDRWMAGALIGSLLLGGCHGGMETEVLERELRRQEDYIYQLQDRIDEYRTALKSCQRQAHPKTGTRKNNGRQSPVPTSPNQLPDADQLTPPSIELGAPTGAKTPDADPPPEPSPDPGSQPTDTRVGTTARATQLVLRARRADTAARLVHTGPGTIRAVVQPTTADGRIVRQPGALAVMILGPPHKGRRARIARWDFSPADTTARWQTSRRGQGIHLNLPWPPGQPSQGTYQIWARLLAADGHKLLAHIDWNVPARGPAPQANRQASRGTPARDDTSHAKPATRQAGTRNRPPDNPTAHADPARPEPVRIAARPARDQAATAETISRPVWKPVR